MTDVQELKNRLCRAVVQWVPVREQTIQEIQKTIENLGIHHRNVNISRITGSTVSIVGSAMAIVGFAIAPVTLGASIGISVTGIALAVAGGSTAAGASIADIVIQKSNVKQAQEQLTRDYDQLNAIREIAEAINEKIEDIKQQCHGVSPAQFAAVFGEVLTQGVVRTGNVGIKIAEVALFTTLEIGATAVRVGGAAARGIAAAGIALNVVLIPIDLIEIVRSSISLAGGSQTKAIERLTEIVVELEEQKKAIEQLRQLRATTSSVESSIDQAAATSSGDQTAVTSLGDQTESSDDQAESHRLGHQQQAHSLSSTI